MKAILIFIFCLWANNQLFAQDLEQLTYPELDSLTNLFYSKKDDAACLNYQLTAMKKAAKDFGEKDSIFAEYASNVSLFYKNLGQYEEAETIGLKTLAVQKEIFGTNHSSYANTLNSLGSLYSFLKEPEQAIIFYKQALEIKKNIFGDTHPEYANALNNLGHGYSKMSEKEEYQKLALSNYLAAAEIWKTSFGEYSLRYATAMNNLAGVYQTTKKWEEAEKCFLKALEILEKVVSKNHLYYATALNGLAWVYYDLGNYPKAESAFLTAIQLLEKINYTHHPYYLTYHNNISYLYFKTGEFDKANDYFNKAIKLNMLCTIEDSLNLSMHLEELKSCDFKYDNQFKTTLRNMNLSALAQYRTLTDASFLKNGYEAITLAIDKNKTKCNEFIGETNKLVLLDEMSFWVNDAIKTAFALHDVYSDNKYLHDAFSYAEQNKSILLTDAIKGNRARSLGDLPDSLAKKELDLQERKEKLKKLKLELKEDKSFLEEETKLEQEIILFLKSLHQKYPKYHSLKYEDITASVNDIQQKLDTQTLFLEYYLTEDSISYLFVLDNKNIDVLKLSIKYEELNLKIKEYHNLLSNYSLIVKDKKASYQNFSDLSHWFYSKLLATALKNKTAKNLIIIPDGNLGNLPFETFLTKPQNQDFDFSSLNYLLNDYNISYNYSATLWKENISADLQQNNGKILAFASAYPAIDSNLKELRTPEIYNLRKLLQPLPSAQNEVTALSNLFVGTFLQNEAASEAFFKKEAPHYGIIHLAMHGLLHQKHPLLSSLAFTENKDPLEDNFLQAFEISKIRLNANLVVLSACETGYGKFEQGEGVLSLARSFMYAGVPSLVVSLWQVNDGSTSIIMASFYAHLADGMTKDAALRQAKLNYLKTAKGITAHPAFWSPFIQLGDNRAIVLKTKGSWGWIIGGGLCILGIIGLFLIKRRKDSTNETV